MNRRTRALSSLILGAFLASVVVFVALDAIACPDGYGDPVASRAPGVAKFRIQLTCRAGGAQAQGSMALVVLSWLGVFFAVTIGGYKLWNRIAPVVTEDAPAAPTPVAAPTDKKARRKARKAGSRV